MIGNSLAYSGIVTKAKAMSSKLISLEDYNKISQLETTADFASFLKSQPGYAPLFENYDERTLHRGQIEHILANSLYMDYSKLFKFATQQQRDALTFIFFRYEVNILKSCMQHAFNKKIQLNLSSFAEFFNSHSKLKINELVASTTMDEFISNLKDTQYYPLFAHLQSSGNPSRYDYESQLDIYYFKRVWTLIDKLLKGGEQKAIKHTVGSQIDLLNILWIYRSKKYYSLESSKIYGCIIPVHYKLRNEQLTKLVETSTVDEFMSALSSTYYGRSLKEVGETSMEAVYRTTMNKLHKQNVRNYPASIAPLYSYLFRKEQDLDKLTTALECIRYNLEPKEILNYVSQ